MFDRPIGWLRMRLARVALATALLPLTQTPSFSAPVQFDGTIVATCTLVVTSNGTLTPSADLQSLSSKNAGGSAGTVSLSTTGGVTVGLDTLAVSSVPASDTSVTTWVQTYSSSGAHTVAETSSDTALADPGLSTLTVHLEGTKSDPDTFSAGSYQATVTVLCE